MTVAITDVKIIEGQSTAVPPGYLKIPVDLNYKAGGKYLYLAFKRSYDTPITGLTVIEGKNTSPPPGYTKIDIDLNWGANGKYLYLCYTKDQNLQPISDIVVRVATQSHEKLSPLYGHDGRQYQIIPVDLNWGAGGAYLYFYYIGLIDEGAYFDNGVKEYMLDNVGKEYESSRIQTDPYKTLIRLQRLVIANRASIPPSATSYKHTIETITGTSKTEAEEISREIGISMGGSFSKFSAEINQKLGFSSSKTFVTYEETRVTQEIELGPADVTRQFIYARVEDILKVIDVPTGATKSESLSRTPETGYFVTNLEGKFVQLEMVEGVAQVVET